MASTEATALVTNVQLLGQTAVIVYGAQQNLKVAEILVTFHLKQGNKQERQKDAVLHFCHASCKKKKKMEITFVS